MIVKEKKDIVFINDCNAIFDDKILRNAIFWYSEKPVCRIKHIYIHAKYPTISIYDKKIQIHRLLKMYQLGVDLDFNQHVHHKDGNKLNAMLDNLEVVEAKIHQSLHNKGKVLSKEHREKISLANKKRKGIKMKKRVDMDNLNELLAKGYSINKISKIYGCDWSTVKNRINETPDLLESLKNETLK